jgi:hypothetical protein
MNPKEIDEIEEREKQPADDARERRVEEERDTLLADVAAGTLNTVERRVAWILNNYPEARNSDITLQIRYWETFEAYSGGPIHQDDLYRLPRLTTLARSRATVQNRYKLFQASAEIRARRGTLSEEERERAARVEAYPVFAVYADESGKTQENLIVGTIWVLHGPESLRLVRELTEWRTESGFRDELHFADINAGNLERHKEAIRIVMRNAVAVSFKAGVVERRGAGPVQQAVAAAFYHTIAGGIDHEHASARAPLPRTFQLWKDGEEIGYDKLVLADVRDRLAARFGDQLAIDVMEAVPSKGSPLVQIADLFTGSINRIVNPPNPAPAQPGPKDEFARFMLDAVGWAPQPVEGSDLAVTVSI